MPVLILLSIPFFAHAGVFSAIVGVFIEETEAAHTSSQASIQTLPLLQAATNADPNPSKGGGDLVVDEGALIPQEGPDGAAGSVLLPSNGAISVYIVREGDALSQIAEMFDVSANTILWANDLKSANLIKPGDSLIILPVSGVRHTVKKGDSVALIAKLYEGDRADIVAYNGLSSEDDLVVGGTVVVPGGRIAPPPAPKKPSGSKPVPLAQTPSGGNGYFAHPAPGTIRTQGIHGYNGVDLAAGVGTPIYAAADGEVIISKGSGWNGGYGSYIVIKHANGTQTLYAHLSAAYVSAGQSVVQGEAIGAMGNTGQSTGPHLHFEVRGARNPF
ncbi:peptidoglycan DD-metalloendopeptidase family protein [Candidatus Kaiserbacteria bacterium]|nr:peptidoglycan DD-metalloendopeptidase family protein [Candidatus Kaiserbacteria bacterium]